MAIKRRETRLTGLNPLAYMGVEPVAPTDFVLINRDPTVNDYTQWNIGDEWENPTTLSVWKLVNKDAGIATWVKFIPVAASSTVVTSILVPGAGNHSLNALTKSVKVIGWNGGAGGGSGRQGVDTHASGGGGGAGGSIFMIDYPVVFFGGAGGIVPYVVGAGGVGGAAQAGANTNGNNGTNGGITSFGNVRSSRSANQSGRGGIATQGDPGTGVNPFFTAFADNGGYLASGGSGTIQASANAPNNSDGSSLSSGGAGGSGADSVTERKAGNGGAMISADGGVIILAGGIGGLESTGINGTNGGSQIGITTGMVGGTGGGGGGGQSVGAAAGNGGNGGLPGGGGGGGGGSLNGTASGAGGNGGNGTLYIIEYL